MNIVTVVNRVDEEIKWMFDGREYKLGPFEEKSMAHDAAVHGYNKTKFALHMELGSWTRAIGIRELGHDVDSLAVKPSDYNEVFDRSTDPSGVNTKVVKFGNPDLALSRPIEGAL